jgi:glutamyl-tRNA synthetase
VVAAGRFVLRVEDTDRERSAKDHVASQLADLAWLGIAWDAGPGRDDGRGPYQQSERGAIYAELFARLEREGLAYPCYCTAAELEVARRTQAAAGEAPRYPGTCRGLDAAARASREREGRKAALRFAIPEPQTVRFDDLVRGPQAIESATLGDFVVRRADGSAIFFFCNAVDDALMGVTDVLRGDDHLSNTPRQLLLLRALSLAAPRYGHLPLLLDADGSPQSKRRGSVTIAELRRRGYLPSAVGNYLLRLGHHGAPDEWVEPRDWPRRFDAARLGRAPAHFDPVQLDHWQREAVRRLDARRASDWLAPAFPTAGPDRARGRRVAPARQRAAAGDARDWLAVLGGALPPLAPDAARDRGGGTCILRRGARVPRGDGLRPRGARRAADAQHGRKGKSLYMPLRFALTGRHDGPELAQLLAAIPPALVRDRLAAPQRLRGG